MKVTLLLKGAMISPIIIILCGVYSLRAQNTGAPSLLRHSVMQVTPKYVIWSVNGSMRVGRNHFRIPKKMWIDGQLKPTARRKIVSVDKVVYPGKDEIKVSAAGDEYVAFQVVVTPRQGDLKIGKAEVSDFIRKEKSIPADQVSIHLVGYLWGTNPLTRPYWNLKPGQTIGPFADPLLPEGAQTTAKQGQNYTLYFKIHVPRDTPQGDYSAQITLQVNDQVLKPLPVKLHVWDYNLSQDTSVDTQLFSISGQSMQYWYGLAPWEERYRRLYKNYLENMAAHRFSPDRTPPLPRIIWRTFPVQVSGKRGKALDFREGRSLSVAGSKFEHMMNGFTVGFWLRTKEKNLDRLLDQSFRQSGYKLSLTQGKLRAKIGLGTLPSGKPWSSKPDPDKIQEVLEANYPSDGRWHYVAFCYKPGIMTLFIDSKKVEQKHIDRQMSPSYVIPRMSGSQFQIDELQWKGEALSTKGIAQMMMKSSNTAGDQLATYSFDSSKFDFSSKVAKEDSSKLEQQYMLKWAKWADKRGLFLNKLKAPSAHAKKRVIKRYDRLYWQLLRKRHLLNQSYVRLPHDESLDPTNLRWSKIIHQVAPQVKRHATLGGMGGAGTSRGEKLQDLENSAGFVDIWSMRPFIYNEFRDFFKKHVKKGNNLSVYIHDANIIETPEVLMSGRLFFWRLFKHDISYCTLWRVSLWFQAVKGGGHRAEKATWRVPWGFETTKRNVSIDGGMIFYPGSNGPMNSLRAEAWRDGIEDFDTFTLLQRLVNQAHKNGHDSEAVRMGRSVLAQVDSTKQIDSRWRHASTTDLSRVNQIRHRAAQVIEQLQEGFASEQNK